MGSIDVKFIIISAFVIGFSDSVNGNYKDADCGEEVSSNPIHQSPWLVLLDYYRQDYFTGARCGGTLVDNRHVLTAAHCVNKISRLTRLVARFGEYKISSEIDCVGATCADQIVQVNVSGILIHSDYADREHDIAVLTLERNVTFSDFVRPVCLPTGNFSENSTFIASGFGEIPFKLLPSDLKKIIRLPFVKREVCEKIYKHLRLPQHIICAGGEYGVDTCKGDSGGPLTLRKQRVELLGVISAGHVHCGLNGWPAFYTNVLDHLEWLRQHLV